ncbi:CD225/dispanin family protein [Streptomyces sp. NPDC017056]|uniref:CD225/dispanin family protein n=1 Tax=Streptomyces sp. NPDC017056 TaxID=3364973 RepID=UPI003789DC66
MAYPQGPPGEDWGDKAPWSGQAQPPPAGPPPQYRHGPSPYAPAYQQYAKPPRSHLIPAILVTLFCFLPTGIAAIVYATQANAKTGSGDWAGAEQAAKKAKLWTFVSIGVALFACLLAFLTGVVTVSY